ncbi:hypothetical protein AVEN_16659-1 [Araneus ventricosus]|uniref:Uncharacterized protein n=1 Tax=Araneus ventricosus TaxID=182803 RepID=A0A4Y2QQ57_ARAVE|nr:hypothetical protein AVEN_191644-1 [Araneus ventricosus]GBN65520.1 hypothetical protein AVEN_16659-1 [Araneus ventricosus]
MYYFILRYNLPIRRSVPKLVPIAIKILDLFTSSYEATFLAICDGSCDCETWITSELDFLLQTCTPYYFEEDEFNIYQAYVDVELRFES